MALSKNFKLDTGSSGRYTLSGLKSGEKVKVRVLTEWIDGKSVWSGMTDEKPTPFRVRSGESIPAGKIGINKINGKPNNIKQFIAAVVWNYRTEQVEILETDKSTIIEAIVELEESEDWGDARNYDLTVSKSGTGMDTKYTVIPSNMGKLKIDVDYQSVNIDALYEGADPFNSTEGVTADSVADDFIKSMEATE